MPALSAAVGQKPGVVLLGLGLPDIDGADVLSMLRAVSDVAVIVAKARDDESEIVRLLDLGADDYIIKPFTAAQMTARIRAVMRRMGRTDEDVNWRLLVTDPLGHLIDHGRITCRPPPRSPNTSVPTATADSPREQT